MWQLWLIVAGLFLVGEIFTNGFLLFWFGIASLIAMLSSFITSNIYIQAITFLISSCILLLASKPLFKKIMKSNNPIETNAFSIINKKGIVLLDIDNSKGIGQIKVNGEIWSAKSETDELITKDSNIIVVSIVGVKAIVSKVI